MAPKGLQASVSSKVRRNIQAGKLVSAVVSETYFDRVTVQLVGNGQLLRNLPITGGPVDSGQSVKVDFSTIPPTVIAKGNKYLSLSDLEDALKDIQNDLLGKDTEISIVLFSGGSMLEMYIPTAEGFYEAVTAAREGDVVWIPDIDIVLSAEIIIPDGVVVSGISTRQSIIRGQIVLGNKSTLENLKIVSTHFTNSEVRGLKISSTTDPAYIVGCEIHSYQCGTGRSNCIVMDNNSYLEVERCLLVADSGDGIGYILKCGTGGAAKITNCRLYAPTELYDEGTATIEVYGNSEADHTELEFWCNLPDNTNFLASAFGDGNLNFHTEDMFNARVGEAWAAPTATMFNSSAGAYSNSVCRKAGYLYTYKHTGTTSVTMRETQISTGTNTDKVVYTASSAQQEVHFCVVGDRQIYVFRSGTAANSFKHTVYLVDFAANTVSTQFQFDTVDPPDAASNYKTYGSFDGVVAVTTAANELIVVAYGRYTETDFDTGNDFAGVFAATRNIAQDGGWVIHGKPVDPEIYDATVVLYSPPMVVKNQYVVWAPMFDVSGSSVEDAYALVVVFSLNLIDGAFSVTKQIYGLDTLHYDIPTYASCVDNYEGRGYFSAHMEISGNDVYRVFKFDPATLTLTNYDDIESDYYIDFLSSRFHGYMLVYLTGGNIDLVRLHDSAVLWDGVAVPNSGSFTAGSDYLCTSVDDNSRVWYFDKPADKMKGILTTNFADVIEFTPGVSDPAEFPFRLVPYHLGDVWVLFLNKYAPSEIRYYYIKE